MVEIVGIPAGQLPNQLQFHLLAPSRKKLDRESTFVAVGPPEYNNLIYSIILTASKETKSPTLTETKPGKSILWRLRMRRKKRRSKE